MDCRVEKGVRVRHREYGTEGTIIKVGTFVTIQLASGKKVEIRKILLWEHYLPVESES